MIERYRAEVVTRKKSAEIEDIILGAFLRSGLGARSLAAYRDARLKKVRPVTVRRELGLVQHCLQVARRDWGIPLHENPLAKVARPKGESRRERRLKASPFNLLH